MHSGLERVAQHRLVLFIILTGIFSSSFGFSWKSVFAVESSVDKLTSKAGGDEDKIIGGSPADPGAYPFQVFVTWSGIDGTYSCGGTLIDSSRFLTAAHCVYRQTASAYKLYLNTLQNPLKGTDPNWIVRGAAKLQPHESFNPRTLINDVAIITLDSVVDDLQFVTLPTADDGDFYVGSTATAIGWGLTANRAGPTSSKLLQVELPVIDKEQCNKLMGITIVSDKICTNSGGKNVCHGDSGGPLLINGVQVGISSHVSAIDDCGSAGAYTRTANYTSWIQNPTPMPISTLSKAFIRRILLAILSLFSQ